MARAHSNKSASTTNRQLKLGLNLGYWAGSPPPNTPETIAQAQQLGFDSIWTSEAYGSDCVTPLAWWGASTERVKLGTAVMQISARQPAATAMAAMTLDHLCGGRFILGLGVSGPQVVEGWYGQPFAKPLARTREYIGILRDIWARQGPVTNAGQHYPLPLATSTDYGKPLKSSLRPLRENIPIYLGAEGPKNIALAAELCDGWLAAFFSPAHESFYRDALSEGFARREDQAGVEEFEVVAQVPIIPHDDVESAADLLRPMYALYFGGMGAKGANFHANVAVRMGYEGVVTDVQALYLEGQREEAAAKIPTALIEQLALIGPADKIRSELERWRESLATTLLISPYYAPLDKVADLVLA